MEEFRSLRRSVLPGSLQRLVKPIAEALSDPMRDRQPIGSIAKGAGNLLRRSEE